MFYSIASHNYILLILPSFLDFLQVQIMESTGEDFI